MYTHRVHFGQIRFFLTFYVYSESSFLVLFESILVSGLSFHFSSNACRWLSCTYLPSHSFYPREYFYHLIKKFKCNLFLEYRFLFNWISFVCLKFFLIDRKYSNFYKALSSIIRNSLRNRIGSFLQFLEIAFGWEFNCVELFFGFVLGISYERWWTLELLLSGWIFKNFARFPFRILLLSRHRACIAECCSLTSVGKSTQ